MTTQIDAELIAESSALAGLCEHLRTRDWFAMDTEFVREDTYFPQLCLIQVATDDRIACIDPLALTDLGPLAEILDDPGITKVLHAGSQDLEIFHHRYGRLPAPVFDTQLAAPLLGYAEQAGYATLVENVLGISLEKGHARADWTQRPLPPEVLAYAADDVRYLVPLYRAMHAELKTRGRLHWLEAEFARLTDPARYAPDPGELWQRLRGVERLKPRAQAVARALAAWRDETARGDDVPRGRIVRDDVLVELARRQPGDRRELARIRGLREGAIKRHGDALLACIKAARDEPPPPPIERRGPRLDTAGEALADMLGAAVRLVAADNDLAPNVLAGRKDLTRIAAGEPSSEVLAGWRAGVVGETLDAIVEGRTGLIVDGGRPVLIRPKD